jgi:threonyl-tRNA synthetase
MALPEKFELEYTDADGQRKRPVMIHRALFGSMERFFGILIEHFAGKFPLWISPNQVKILTVSDKHIPYAKEIAAKIKSHGFNVVIDDTNESVGKKVRNAQLNYTNYMLTLGDKEVENKTVNIRTRDNIVRGESSVEDFLQLITKERDTRSLTSELK